MQISNNKVVLLEYELKIPTGEVVDKADSNHPFAFIHGLGQTLPAFDEQLTGLKIGDTFAFQLSANDAYGQMNEADVVTIPKEIFGDLPEEELVVGAELPMQDGQGNHFYGIVQEVQEQFVIMDFNHPLVGQDLDFNGKIIEVRDATPEELAHGHAHGVGGHQH
ncbi:MAG: peptidylprolyl isomerase [Cytophagales bacterium]|nr:MAG: peptidylprolyl isomerase [Cytophagales bacterium]